MTRLLWVSLLAVCQSVLTPCIPGYSGDGSFYIGSGNTDPVPASKLWYVGQTWWTILYDGVDHFFYKTENGHFVKQSFPDALVDPSGKRVDVLWNGNELFVLQATKLRKYSYDAATEEYSQLPGFPVTVPMAGSREATVMAQDSTGKLWIAYDSDVNVIVTWSISADHTQWDPQGVYLATNTKTDDICSITSFEDKIGVMWSDQVSERFLFAVHQDGDPEVNWSAPEVVADQADIADDHINFAVTEDDIVLAATKSSIGDRLYLYARRDGIWEGPFLFSTRGTRPIVVYHETNREVYVFYTDWLIDPNPVVYKKAPLDDLASLASADSIELIPPQAGNDVRNPTSTKQRVTASSGLYMIATSNLYAHYRCVEAPNGNSPPSVVASATPQLGEAPLAVNFSAVASDSDGTITAYSWDFGDGAGSNEANPTHTYTAPGNYISMVTVTDDGGLTATDAVTIEVTLDPADDVMPPVITARSPDAGDSNVPVDASIEVVVVDYETDVDESSLQLFVNGELVATVASAVSGGYELSYTPPSPWGFEQEITVRVVAQDFGAPPNTLDETYSFTTQAAAAGKINFQPTSVAAPSGYEADYGEAYSASRGYGWSSSVRTRVRNWSPDPTLDTYAYVKNTGTEDWYLDAPNGSYEVTIVVGSPKYSGIHTVAVNGVTVIDAFPTSGGEFLTLENYPVVVSNGRLTLTLGGSGDRKKTKICRVEVRASQ